MYVPKLELHELVSFQCWVASGWASGEKACVKSNVQILLWRKPKGDGQINLVLIKKTNNPQKSQPGIKYIRIPDQKINKINCEAVEQKKSHMRIDVLFIF